MIVHRLSLANFRNYRQLDQAFASGPILVLGDNAQGKSNLLEALYLLAASKSPWATSDRELVHWDAASEDIPVARVVGEIERSGQQVKIELALQALRPGSGQALRGAQDEGDVETPQLDTESVLELAGHFSKRVRINDVPRRAVDLVGLLRVVLFSPRDVELIGGEPALRRRFLDLSLSQADRTYLRRLQEYSKVLLQRNHLLRQIGEGEAGESQLEFWDERLVENAAALVARRLTALAQLGPLARNIHAELSDNGAVLRVAYVSSLQGDPAAESPSQEELCQQLRYRLRQARRREIGQGATTIGPHRDDLRFTVNRVDMHRYGSRGQQRIVALALKLAEARWMEQETGEAPILLLDETLAELDARHRQHLLYQLRRYHQVFLTATDLDHFEEDFVRGATLFRVVEGILSPVPSPSVSAPPA